MQGTRGTGHLDARGSEGTGKGGLICNSHSI